METDGPITILYEMENGAPAYDERSADRVHIWHEETFVATLAWRQGRWIDIEPCEISDDTPLWLDIDTWLEHNLLNGEVTV
jgi:hypothetical protein